MLELQKFGFKILKNKKIEIMKIFEKITTNITPMGLQRGSIFIPWTSFISHNKIFTIIKDYSREAAGNS